MWAIVFSYKEEALEDLQGLLKLTAWMKQEEQGQLVEYGYIVD